MSDQRFSRQQILEAFGVSEVELASVDRGYQQARAEADARRQAYVAWLRQQMQLPSPSGPKETS